jgi:D-aspartate ligase
LEPPLLDNTSSTIRPPVLLASPSYAGTLAAVRHLGRNGIEVRILSDRYLLDAAAWSRYTSRSYRTPPELETHRFLERLLSIGASEPTQVLLPTSDETAWLYTANATLLAKYFRVHQPPIAAMQNILDKKQLSDAATKAGLAVLPTWAPSGLDDLSTLAASLPYPILIKPRTHVHHSNNDKGSIVHSPNELISEYRKRIRDSNFQATNGVALNTDGLPILQRFVTVGTEGIRSVTGFISRKADHFLTRDAIKVFQRTEPLGVGVCFESVPTVRELSDSVNRLCKIIGFYGIFEVEFVWFDGQWNLIDFNPRMFNQMALDISRGLPLPLLLYLDAIDDQASLDAAVEISRSKAQHQKAILFDGFTMRAILTAKTMTLRATKNERSHWKSWMKRNSSYSMDVAADKSDRMPGIIHAISEIYLGLKALPEFLYRARRPNGNAASEKTAAQ